MKRYSIQLLVLCVSVMTAFCVKAQEQVKERLWSVGASYLTSVGGNHEGYSKYMGFSVDGAYRVKLYRSLNLHPGLSLYYTSHESPEDAVNKYPDVETKVGKVNEWGMKVTVPIGVHLPYQKIAIDLETGPQVAIYFSQAFNVDETINGSVEHEKISDFGRRCNFYWNFSAGVNFCKDRIYVKLNYGLAMSKLKTNLNYKYSLPDVFSVGVGYNF